jgi:hypothetical protein
MKILTKMIYRVFLLLGGISVLTACYEDKGNYNYKDIGSVTVKVEEEQALQRIMMGNNIQITPVYSLDKVDKKDLTFTWDIVLEGEDTPTYKVLSNEEVLDVPLVEAPGKYSLRLGIRNEVTGVTSYGYYLVEVTTALTRSFLLLCEVGEGMYDIEAAPDLPTIGIVVHNLYSSINGEYLKGAKKIVYKNNFLKYEDFLWIIQEQGGQSLSTVDLTYHGDATTWFFEAPSPIVPLTILGDAMGMTYYMVVNGSLYYINNLSTPFKAGMPVLTRDQQEYNITGVATVINASKYEDYAFWDQKGKRFLHWQSTTKTLETMETVAGAFDPNDVGDMTPFFMGDGVKDRSYNFMKDASGKVHMFVFKNSSASYNKVVAEPYRHVVLDDKFEFEKATAICPSRRLEVIYYAVGNIIYLFDPLLNERRIVYEDSDKEMRFVKLYYKDNYDNRVIAAGNSGDKGYFYRIYLNSAGDIMAPTEERPLPWDQLGPYPKIVDMEYKYKAY